MKKFQALNWTSRAKRHFRLFKFRSLNFKTNMASINWAPFLLISNSSTFLSMGRFFNCFKICFKFSNRSIPRLSCFSSSLNSPSASLIVSSLPSEISFLHIKTNLSNLFRPIFVLISNRRSLYSISDIFSVYMGLLLREDDAEFHWCLLADQHGGHRRKNCDLKCCMTNYQLAWRDDCVRRSRELPDPNAIW